MSIPENSSALECLWPLVFFGRSAVCVIVLSPEGPDPIISAVWGARFGLCSVTGAKWEHVHTLFHFPKKQRGTWKPASLNISTNTSGGHSITFEWSLAVVQFHSWHYLSHQKQYTCCRIQEIGTPARVVMSIKFEDHNLQVWRFRHVELRQSNSVPGD